MSPSLAKYRVLEQQLIHMRWEHDGAEAEGEEQLLERMTDVWWELDDEERALLRAEGPRSQVRAARTPGTLVLFERDPSEGEPGARRQLREVA